MSYFLNQSGTPSTNGENTGEGGTNKVTIDMVEGLEQELLEIGEGFSGHTKDEENPHKVTKEQIGLDKVRNVEQATKEEAKEIATGLVSEAMSTVNKEKVGLGSVQNYGVATKVEAEEGTSNSKYMTPIRVKEAIAKQATEAVSSHTSDKNNPHGVTKGQVGLDKVQNYGVATTVSAEAGSSQNEYMTPFLTKKLLDKNVVKSDSVTSTSSETLATSNAVKTANDTAKEALSKTHTLSSSTTSTSTTVGANSKAVKDAMDRADSAHSVAENASGKASRAQTTADDALSKANSASSSASSASSSASSALSKANSASSSISSHISNKASGSSYSHVKTTSSAEDLASSSDVALVPTAKLVGEVITASNLNTESLVEAHAITKATGSRAGHVQLNSSVFSSQGISDGHCATPSAVKTAYDKAKGAEAKANEAFQQAVDGKKTLVDGFSNLLTSVPDGEVEFYDLYNELSRENLVPRTDFNTPTNNTWAQILELYKSFIKYSFRLNGFAKWNTSVRKVSELSAVSSILKDNWTLMSLELQGSGTDIRSDNSIVAKNSTVKSDGLILNSLLDSIHKHMSVDDAYNVTTIKTGFKYVESAMGIIYREDREKDTSMGWFYFDKNRKIGYVKRYGATTIYELLVSDAGDITIEGNRSFSSASNSSIKVELYYV